LGEEQIVTLKIQRNQTMRISELFVSIIVFASRNLETQTCSKQVKGKEEE
jgi:hypothetical protein